MTDKSRAAFEAWYRSDEDKDLTDNAPSIDDLDAHHKYWMLAAWEASRRQALAEPEQPARVPLTREQVNELLCSAGYTEPQERADFINGVRHCEAAHGITAQHASVPFLPGEYETLTERCAVAWAGYDPKDDNK